MLGRKVKRRQLEDYSTRGDKSEITGERRMTKKILRMDQTTLTKQDIPKQRKKSTSK